MAFRLKVVLASIWILVVATAGGFVCGLAIARFGEMGSISLWAMGALAGYVAQRILRGRSRPLGIAMIIGCITTFVVAEACWIHWTTTQGAVSWFAAFTLLPTFAQQYKTAALFGTIFTAFGAWSAYRQIAGYQYQAPTPPASQ